MEQAYRLARVEVFDVLRADEVPTARQALLLARLAAADQALRRYRSARQTLPPDTDRKG